jgi:hypothetical protein
MSLRKHLTWNSCGFGPDTFKIGVSSGNAGYENSQKEPINKDLRPPDGSWVWCLYGLSNTGLWWWLFHVNDWVNNSAWSGSVVLAILPLSLLCESEVEFHRHLLRHLRVCLCPTVHKTNFYLYVLLSKWLIAITFLPDFFEILQLFYLTSAPLRIWFSIRLLVEKI